MKCPLCGIDVKPGYRSCPDCGEVLRRQTQHTNREMEGLLGGRDGADLDGGLSVWSGLSLAGGILCLIAFFLPWVPARVDLLKAQEVATSSSITVLPPLVQKLDLLPLRGRGAGGGELYRYLEQTDAGGVAMPTEALKQLDGSTTPLNSLPALLPLGSATRDVHQRLSRLKPYPDSWTAPEVVRLYHLSWWLALMAAGLPVVAGIQVLLVLLGRGRPFGAIGVAVTATSGLIYLLVSGVFVAVLIQQGHIIPAPGLLCGISGGVLLTFAGLGGATKRTGHLWWLTLLLVGAFVGTTWALMLQPSSQGRTLAPDNRQPKAPEPVADEELIASNEAAALKLLEEIQLAQETLAGHRAGSLEELVEARLLPSELASGRAHGYLFEMQVLPNQTYEVIARPAAPGQTGRRWFRLDHHGAIFERSAEAPQWSLLGGA